MLDIHAARIRSTKQVGPRMCEPPPIPPAPTEAMSMTHAVAASGRPNQPGGVLWWGKTTPFVSPPSGRGSVCYLVLQR